MIELFSNISQNTRKRAEAMFKIALAQPTLLKTVQTLHNYTELCTNDEEKEFVEFYFNMKLEQLQNGDNDNQRQKPIG